MSESSTGIRGVLFDKDGTLFDFHASWAAMTEAMLDSLAPDAEAWGQMARAAGYRPEEGRFMPGSVIVSEPTSVLAGLWSRWRPDLGAERIERIANEAAGESAPGALRPAVADLPALLMVLANRGLVLGVATHDEEDAARRQLASVGALDAFAFVAGYDSGHGAKPGPGMLRAFGRATGLEPAAIAMVGDSRHDLQMVPAAGAALAIGVLTGPAGQADLAPHADYILPSIAELPGLLDRLAGPKATSI